MSAAYDIDRTPARKADPSSLTHAERDALGHFASSLREAEYLARRRYRWNWYAQRYADLMKVFRARVGPKGQIPEGVDDAMTLIRCFAHHFQARPDVDDVGGRLGDWCSRHCAGWVEGWSEKRRLIGTVLDDVAGQRRDMGARRLAVELHVTYAERYRLGLRTIGCCDLTPGEFRRRALDNKRENDRVRVSAKRRSAGMQTWAERSRLSREQPWIALGISRATYFRRRKIAGTNAEPRETVVSQIGEASNVRDTTVSRQIVGETVQERSSVSVGRNADAGSHHRNVAIAETMSVRQETPALHDALSPFGKASAPSHRRANIG